MINSTLRFNILRKLAWVLNNGDDWYGSLSGTGPVFELEEKFKRLTGHQYALGMANATLALWQVFKVFGILNTQVICSPITWGGMLTGALLSHNELIFADVDAQTLNPTVKTIKPLIGKHTKALLLNDTFGYPSVGPELRQLARNRGLTIIQDCSAGFGSWIYDGHTGAFADVAVFSLGPGKALSGSEGAIVVTSEKNLYERLVELTQHPQRIRRDVPWNINQFALNCRISAVGATIAGTLFYPRLEFLLKKRNRYVTILKELNLAGLTDTQSPPAEIIPNFSTFSFSVIPKRARRLSDWVAQSGMPVRVSPPPICQPVYQDPYFKKHYPQKHLANCPVAEAQSHRRAQLIISNNEEIVLS